MVPRTVGSRAPEPARGMPLAGRAALLVAVGALVLVVLTSVSGALPSVIGTIGKAVGGITDAVLVSPSPSTTPAPISEAPTLVSPENPYTNTPTTTLAGTVPLDVVGRADYLVRIYVALPDQEPQPVRDVPIGETPSFVVSDLALEPGRNDVTATLVGPGGEGEPSSLVTVVLDTSKPKVTISSPANGTTVNRATVTITGKTQARSSVVARNEANGTAATATAGSTGSFSLEVPLSAGTNGISVTATDPAGNAGTTVVTVKKGSGRLSVALTASASRLRVAQLPRSIELRATVTGPSGSPVRGELVTFTLGVQDVPTITGEGTTDAAGVATCTIRIPAGAAAAPGLATASVSTTDLGMASGTFTITIVK